MQSYLPVTLRLQTSFMCHSESSKVLSDNLIVIASENVISFKKYFRYLNQIYFFSSQEIALVSSCGKYIIQTRLWHQIRDFFAIGRLVLSLDQIRFFGGNCNCTCERQNGSSNNETCCQVAPVCLPTFGIVRFVFIWFAFFLDWHFFHISPSLLVSKSTWFQCPRLDTCPIKYLLENQMCRVIQELFQRWHVHRLKEQFDVSHARFDLEDDFFS